MEDKEGAEHNVEEALPKEDRKETKIDVENTVIKISNEAGPSGNEHLPGAVSTPQVHRSRKSKSDHSIPKIITNQDVADALKFTSSSFVTNQLPIKIDFKDLKVPTDENRDITENSTTIHEVKNTMARCLTLNMETPHTEAPVRVLSTVVNNIPNLPECANTNCIQTDNNPVDVKDNEVIVTSHAPSIEAKVKNGSEKKKTENSTDKPDMGITRESLSSIGSNVCRICMTRGRERLISPCNCKGSLANVHLSCLERWLNQVGRNHCELCGFSYPAIRTPRYTVLQALRLWFGNPRNRSHLQSDCLIFWLLSTVTAGLLAVCIVGTQYFVIEGNKFGKGHSDKKEEGISHRITETALDFFMAVILCGYSVTVYLLWKDHFVTWNRWRRANVNVRLLITPDVAPMTFVPKRLSNNVQ